MTYATQQQFIDAFGSELTIELTNLEDATATTVNATVFDRVAADSDELINSYLSGRYALPLAQTPGLLRTLALDIYRYKLGHNAQEEDVRQRYEDALKVLQQIAQGLLNLGLPLADEPLAKGSPKVFKPAGVFTRDNLSDFSL
jgi:phage gp36-like protein